MKISKIIFLIAAFLSNAGFSAAAGAAAASSFADDNMACC